MQHKGNLEWEQPEGNLKWGNDPLTVESEVCCRYYTFSKDSRNGGNVVRRDLGEQAMKDITLYTKMSIEYAIENPDEALEFAKKGNFPILYFIFSFFNCSSVLPTVATSGEVYITDGIIS